MRPVIYGLTPLLQVFDIPQSVNFYCEVIGFTLIEKSGEGKNFNWALLTLNKAELMLHAAYEPNFKPLVPDQSRIRAHNDTAIFFGCEDLDALYDHCRSHHIILERPFRTGYGFRALTVRDPDGYELCFHWPATQEAYDKWVQRYGFEPRKIK